MKQHEKWLTIAGLVAVTDQAFFVTLNWILISSQGAKIGALLLGVIAVVRLLSLLITGPIADRYGATRLVFATLIGRVVIFLALIPVFISGNSLAMVLIAILFGVVDGTFLPSAGALLKSVTQQDEFSKSVAVLQIITSLSTGAAAAVAGINLSLSLTGATVAGCAVFSLIAVVIFLVSGFRKLDTKGKNDIEESITASLVGGFRLSVAHRNIATGLLLAFLIEITMTGALNVGLPDYLTDLTRGSEFFGWAVTLFCIGGVIGGFTASQVTAEKKRQHIVIASLFVFAASNFAISFIDSLIVLLVCVLVIGISAGAAAPILIADIMKEVPDTHSSRIYALINLVTYGTIPVAYVAAGFIADSFGAKTVFLVSGIILLIGGSATVYRTDRIAIRKKIR